MDDKELIKVWRNDFEISWSNGRREEVINALSCKETAWAAFYAFKKSQPVVELPKQINCEGVYFDLDGYQADEIHSALTAAGIQYKVRG